MGESTNAFQKSAGRPKKKGSTKRGFDTLRLAGSKLVAAQRFEWLYEQGQGATTSSVDWGSVRVDGSRATGGFYGKHNQYAKALAKLSDARKYLGGRRYRALTILVEGGKLSDVTRQLQPAGKPSWTGAGYLVDTALTKLADHWNIVCLER